MILDVFINTDELNEDVKEYILNNKDIAVLHIPHDDTKLTDIDLLDKTAKLHVSMMMITRLGRENFGYIKEVKLKGCKMNSRIYIFFELVMEDEYNEKKYDC